jgi:TolA-binding protein
MGKSQVALNRVFFVLLTTGLLIGCGRVRVDEGLTAEEQWRIAREHFDNENYLNAIDVLNVFTLNYSGSTLIDSAQFLLGECHFALKEYILAESEYNRLIQNFPQSPLVDDAFLKVILCNAYLSPGYKLDQKYTEKTLASATDFIEDYPSTDAAVHLKAAESGWRTVGRIFTLGLYHPRRKNPEDASLFDTEVVFPHRPTRLGAWLLKVATLGIYKPAPAPVIIPSSRLMEGEWIAEKARADAAERLAKKVYKAGELYYRQGKFPSAVIYFDRVMELHRETSWAERAAWLKGEAFFSMRKYADAAQAYERYIRDFDGDREQEAQQKMDLCKRYMEQTALQPMHAP